MRYSDRPRRDAICCRPIQLRWFQRASGGRKFVTTSCAIFGCVLLLFATIPQPSYAIPISGTGALGSFTGDFTYDNVFSQLVVTLTNTSPVANGGFLNAFAFNNPSGLITGVPTFTSPDNPNFNLLGGASFDNTIAAQPFGPLTSALLQPTVGKVGAIRVVELRLGTPPCSCLT